MIYAQLRENERTARYEVKVIAGNKCEPVVESAELSVSSTPTKSRTTKKTTEAAGTTEWRIGQREEPCWVDLEAELRHMIVRAPIDFGINSAEKSDGHPSGAGSELSHRLTELTDDLYRIEAMESFMQYLSILNIFEYLRIVAALDRVDANNAQASQVGIIGPEYFAQRKIALQLDLAELTEWLVAHGIGLPDLSIFYPSRFSGGIPEAAPVAAVAAPKKKGRKKAGDAEAEAAAAEEAAAAVPQTPIPEALYYVAELIRLQQATLYDLVKFVDDIQQRNHLESPRAAIGMMQREVVQWLDADHFATIYESAKKEEQLATMRQQAALERQRQAFDAKPRRGAKGKHELRKDRGGKLVKNPRYSEPSPLEEFTSSMDEDPDEAYELAMQRASERPEGFEFVPEELLGQDNGNGAVHHDEEEEDPEERKRRQRERILGINAARREREAEGEQSGSHNLFSEAEFEIHDDEHFDGDDAETREQDEGEGEEGEEGDNREPGMAPRPRPEPGSQAERDEHERRRRRPRSRRGGRGRDDRAPRDDRSLRDDRGPRNDRPREDRGPRPERRDRPAPQPRAEKPRPQQRRRGGGGGLDYDEVQPVSNYTPGLPVSAQPGAIPPPPSATRGQGGGGAGKPKRRWRGRR